MLVFYADGPCGNQGISVQQVRIMFKPSLESRRTLAHLLSHMAVHLTIVLRNQSTSIRQKRINNAPSTELDDCVVSVDMGSV